MTVARCTRRWIPDSMKPAALAIAIACLAWYASSVQARQLKQYVVYITQQGELSSVFGSLGLHSYTTCHITIVYESAASRCFACKRNPVSVKQCFNCQHGAVTVVPHAATLQVSRCRFLQDLQQSNCRYPRLSSKAAKYSTPHLQHSKQSQLPANSAKGVGARTNAPSKTVCATPVQKT